MGDGNGDKVSDLVFSCGKAANPRLLQFDVRTHVSLDTGLWVLTRAWWSASLPQENTRSPQATDCPPPPSKSVATCLQDAHEQASSGRRLLVLSPASRRLFECERLLQGCPTFMLPEALRPGVRLVPLRPTSSMASGPPDVASSSAPTVCA